MLELTLHAKQEINRIMTTKELLDSVIFKEIAPYLSRYLGNAPYDFYGTKRIMHCYREAFDRLSVTEPSMKYKGEEVNIDDLMDAPWDIQLASTIEMDDYMDWPLAKKVARALWNLTYYGTSKSSMWRVLEDYDKAKVSINKYDRALQRLEESIWKHQTPRRVRCRFSRGAIGYTLPRTGDKKRKSYAPLNFNRKLNRSKRKRKFRQEKRKEWYKKMITKQYIIDRFTADGSNFGREKLSFILACHGTVETFKAVKPENALECVLESIENYTCLPYENYDRSIVFVEYPKGWTVSKEEKEAFRKKILNIIGYEDIKFGSRTYDDNELAVSVLLYKLKPWMLDDSNKMFNFELVSVRQKHWK